MKSSQGAKGKRKNNGPAEQRYKTEMRWLRNATRRQARAKRAEKAKAAKLERTKRVGYRARQLKRSSDHQQRKFA